MDSVTKKLKSSPFVRAEAAYKTPPFPAPVDLYLDGNEGIPIESELLREVANLDIETVRRYPKLQPLENLLADRFAVDPKQLIVTAGADDALERAIRATVAPGQEVVLPVPTFEMIERYVKLAGGVVKPVMWLDGEFPVDDVISQIGENTGMIGVVTPNSPTGLTASFEDIAKISAAAPDVLLVVDLAYVEFADEDITASVLTLPNTIVTRTLSKAWGLAGARVGYALGSLEAISLMRASGHPYAVSSISLALAKRRLETGQAQVDAFVEQVKLEREQLSDMVRGFGIPVPPSSGNFIFVTVPDGMALRNGLAHLGIAVRGFPGNAHLGNSLRITLPGNPVQFKRLYDGLKALLEK